VLSQVICEYCNHSCDLDLTRQREELNLERNSDDPIKFLMCTTCNTEYDRDDIEQRLVENVHTLVCKWQLQDLRCKRCRLVKAEDMREQCAACKGAIQPTLDHMATTRQIGVLKNLATFFEMDNLEEAISWIA
jgi:DNA polymerase epsilon subunit 1